MSLRIISLNARGLGSSDKLNKIIHELCHLRCDVVFLQETHVSCRKQAEKLEKLWTGKCFWSFGTGKSAGVAVLFSPNFSGKLIRFLTDSDGRILSLLIDFQTSVLNLVNIYAPNVVSDRKSFFSTLHNYFIPQGLLLLGGDFNCIDNVLDKLNCTSVPSGDKTSLASLMSDFTLVDVWRKRNMRKVTFTWFNSDHTQASRIDRFFLAKSLLANVSFCDILPCVFSDHDFVKLDLSLDDIPNRGSGVWRFNNSLLSDLDFKSLLSSTIVNFKLKIPCFDTLREWWDCLKIEIRKACISFSVRKHKSLNAKRISLTKQLIRAKNASRDVSLISDLENQLSALISKQADGAKIRSRAQWFEEGEKPTRYFFRLERKRAESNTINSLLDDDGIEKNSQLDLENILSRFYQNLFTCDSLNMQIQTELIDDLGFSLTDHEREMCEGLFTLDELFASLKGLQTGKTPGSDGLSTEFYLCFWNDLGESLLAVLNESFHAGSLAKSQYEGLLRLVHKKDDRRLPKNWRPISLLNTDYKLASKIITERLKKVMNSIVHQDQTCGVVGRTIFSNLHLVRDTLDFIDKTNEPAILLTLDQEKAFDRVDHEFMLRVLRKFGFGPSFCKWVEIFYAHAFSRILINGTLSCPVYLHRGVRQGCPLSPLLYVLVSEVLSTQIRNCKEVEGFLLPGAGGLQFKISQYADDATLILKSEKSLCNVLSLVHKFELGSGAKLNTSKSEAMWLGRWRGMGDSPFGLRWVTKIRILGVFFSNGLVSVDNDNWTAKLNKLSSALGLWKQRDLSFVGRSLIVNVIGASRLWHVAKVIAPPSWVYDKFKSIVWPFIWNGKMENVSRDRCCAPVKSGGLNVVNFDVKCASLRLSNFLSLRDDFGTCKWHYLARYFLGNRLATLDSRFSFTSNAYPSANLPSIFYSKCLASFRYLFSSHKTLPDDLSCKSLYLLLLVSPPVAPRSAAFWGSVVGRPINRWAWVWRKSRLKLVENKKNDLIWLLVHKAVRVRYALKVWGYISNDKCAVCNRIETIKHCFLECPRVVKLWDHFSPLLSILLDSPFSPSPASVFYPFSNTQFSTGASLCQYLLATIIYWCWFARNSATFRNSILTSDKIISLIKRDIQLRIRCDRPDSVRNFWSFKSVFCSVSPDDTLSFFPLL